MKPPPRLLAAEGARLEAFYAQPVCTPTRAALLTGRYPIRYGLQVGLVRPWSQFGLPLGERTLAQALAEAGYETAIFGKWHLGHHQRAYLPTQRGFQHQYGPYNGAIDYFSHVRDGGLDWHRDDQVNHDPGNLAAAQPEKTEELRARLEAFTSQAAPKQTAPQPESFRSPAVWGETE